MAQKRRLSQRRLSLNIQQVHETHQRPTFPVGKDSAIAAPPVESAVDASGPEPFNGQVISQTPLSDNDDAAEESGAVRPVSASNIVSDLANTLVTLGHVGRGTSGEVKQGVDVITGQLVAIKQISMLNNEHRCVRATMSLRLQLLSSYQDQVNTTPRLLREKALPQHTHLIYFYTVYINDQTP